ncbi:hypothetical protein LIER_27608 [Lithospermum erythrorhizon]|uniref:Uncharacterized protein n=1 Tax=Lithospermum erythrorhizon TaxID=34254 RepID=A0AAV3RG27_LITER
MKHLSSDDVKALGGGPSKFKVSEEVLISEGDRGSPIHPPGFGPLLSDSDQYKGAGIEILPDFGGLLSSSSPRRLHQQDQADIQASFKGDGAILKYSKGTITLNQKSRNFLNSKNSALGEGIDFPEYHITPSTKGKAVILGPSKICTPSKKKFHPYIEANTNGSQSKKPILSSSRLDGSDSSSQSAEAVGLGLLNWKRDALGNVQQKIDSKQATLDTLNQGTITNVSKVEAISLINEIDKLRAGNDEYWRQRCRVEWHVKGDRNTAYLIGTLHISTLSLLHCYRMNTELATLTRRRYNSWLQISTKNYSLRNLLQAVSICITLIQKGFLLYRDSLDKEFLSIEVKNNVFSIKGNKAPGPNRMSSQFFSTLL